MNTRPVRQWVESLTGSRARMRVVRRRSSRKSGVVQRACAIVLTLVVVALVLLLGACGSDEEATTTTAGASTTTVATGGGTSSTVDDSSTTTSTSTSSTVPVSESTDTTGDSPTTTEALSSAESRLPNGHIKAMGYIDAAWEEDGTRYISIDYAEMLTGEEAVEAAHDAGAIPPEQDWMDNDYFISNVNPMRREFTVADPVVITTATYGGVMDLSIDWDVFKSFWTEFPPEGASHMYDMPWWIERDGQTVVRIDEQYLP